MLTSNRPVPNLFYQSIYIFSDYVINFELGVPDLNSETHHGF